MKQTQSKPVKIPDDVFELLMQITKPQECGVHATHDERVWADCLKEVQLKITHHKERLK